MLARVFPRRTKATPTDNLAFCREPQLQDFTLGITEVHVSCTYTYDREKAERMAALWSGIAPVRIGGPAVDPGDPAAPFVPGRYLKPGYVLTSRGCPNRCSFCVAWKRAKGKLWELPVVDGWNVLDDNILATSRQHFSAVIQMLSVQGLRASFTGGLDAELLTDWHVQMLAQLQPKPAIWMACDSEDAFEPLTIAAGKLREAGFSFAGHRVGCYVLIGHNGDTFDNAERRLERVVKLGLFPQAMLYRGKDGKRDPEWIPFAREWANKKIVGAKMATNQQEQR